MSSQVWRISYEADSLAEVISSGELHFPQLNEFGPGKHNNRDKILSDMGEGAFLILANYNSVDGVASIKAAGVVTKIGDDEAEVNWKKVVPSLSLNPHKIGAEQWKSEPVFLMNAPRAKEFKLDKLKKKMFG